MFASAFDQGGAAGSRVTLDDIIEALQSAKTSLQQARAASTPQQPSTVTAIDLRQNPQAFIVAERPFATGEVYKPISSLFVNLSDAKRDLMTRTKQSRSAGRASVPLLILRVKIQGPLTVEADEEDDDHESEDDNGIKHQNDSIRRRPVQLFSGSGADNSMDIFGLPPAKEETRFKESFSHFDDDIGPVDRNEKEQKEEKGPSATSIIDVDRWFDNPTSTQELGRNGAKDDVKRGV